MNRFLLIGTAIYSCCLASSRGELDSETLESLSSFRCFIEPAVARREIPLLVTVVDAEGVPVANAAVALMRIEKDGFTEADVIAASNPRTDASGRVLINYPATIKSIDPEHLRESEYVSLTGAITVIHPAFPAAQVELSSRYPEPFKMVNPQAVPWVKITLAKGR